MSQTVTRPISAAAEPAGAARPGWQIPAARLAALVALGAFSVPLYARVVQASPMVSADPSGFGWPLAAITALYGAAAALVWRAHALNGGGGGTGWRWAELMVIVAVGLALRVVVFGAPPGLSHDAYRYAWDPQLVAHGISPYTHTPQDPALAFLRDDRISPNLRFRDAPTLYPPAAQALFLVTYLLDPRDIYGVKLAMTLCDALAFLLTLALLRARRQDIRLALLYWWAPIPILEFASNGHVDAEAIRFTLAALLASAGSWRGARVTTGVLLGLAALTKLYPLLFVIPLIRRRDYGLLLGLLGTVVAGYAPFAVLGLGGGGYLATYLGQRFADQGPLLMALNAPLNALAAAPAILIGADFGALAALAGVVALYRWRLGLDPVAGLLGLSAAWIAVSPHLFPWYIAALAPLLALTPGGGGRRWPEGLALALWVFMLAMPFTYVIFAPGGNAGLFIWFSIAPAAIGLAPLARAERRAALGALLRRLFAPVTRAELQLLWAALAPSRGGGAGD